MPEREQAVEANSQADFHHESMAHRRNHEQEIAEAPFEEQRVHDDQERQQQ